MINQKQKPKINNYFFIKTCGMESGNKIKYGKYYRKLLNGSIRGLNEILLVYF